MAIDSAGAVRLITGLTEAELTNDNIVTLLELNGDVVRLAAADALEAYAGTLLDVQSDDITLSGSRRAATLLARARSLRAQAAEAAADSDDGFAFDVVPPTSCRPELTERPYW